MVFDEYVQPSTPKEPAAVAVHGITPERVASALGFAEPLPALTGLFNKCCLIIRGGDVDHDQPGQARTHAFR
ncbi:MULTISPECIES: hypothetical protein [unclassified Streptomyces]|uniref:hypothetical protein n=1 Tax=unclassified Streptomyces TaxID=2593676 RepID=UPI002349A500|nr:hypothetical protein [Streptomyces sp. M92]WCN05080.1 hypothetical protein M6G08_24835 [Streptomyces sp. M92]